MIHPNELRIGNLLFNAGGLAIPTTSQTISDLELKLIVRKRIPLTEEWLLKAGAEAYEFDHKPNQYRIGDRLIVIRDGCFYEYGTNVKLEFVHRFQNLFFELQNGKELEFKL